MADTAAEVEAGDAAAPMEMVDPAIAEPANGEPAVDAKADKEAGEGGVAGGDTANGGEKGSGTLVKEAGRKEGSEEADAEAARERSERKAERKREKKEKKERKEKRERRSRSVDRHRERDGRRDSSRREREHDLRDSGRRRSRSKDRDRRDSSRRRRSRSHDDHRRRSRSRSRSRDRRRRRSRSRDDHRRGGRSRRSRSGSSDFGGYVPRKRSDTHRPPADAPYSASMGGSDFSKAPAIAGRWANAKQPAPDPAEVLRQLQEQQLQARQMLLQQQAAAAQAAASKTQREVYVGNLAMGLVTEPILRTLFNNTLAASFPNECASGMEPVVSVNMHSDGRYAFVEMRTPEMATEALKISGLNLLGTTMSCGRPSGYVDPAIVAMQAAEASRQLHVFQAGQGGLPGAGGLPGPPTSVPGAGLPGPPAMGPGIALPGLPGVTLPGPPAVSAAGVVPSPGASVPAVPAAAAAPAAAEVPTAIICVENMFTEAVLMDAEEFVDVMQDLQDECAKLGNVVDLKVPKPPGPGMYGQGDYGKAYVAFSLPAQAKSAKALLDGRSFDGQVLKVTYVAEVPK